MSYIKESLPYVAALGTLVTVLNIYTSTKNVKEFIDNLIKLILFATSIEFIIFSLLIWLTPFTIKDINEIQIFLLLVFVLIITVFFVYKKLGTQFFMNSNIRIEDNHKYETYIVNDYKLEKTSEITDRDKIIHRGWEILYKFAFYLVTLFILIVVTFLLLIKLEQYNVDYPYITEEKFYLEDQNSSIYSISKGTYFNLQKTNIGKNKNQEEYRNIKNEMYSFDSKKQNIKIKLKKGTKLTYEVNNEVSIYSGNEKFKVYTVSGETTFLLPEDQEYKLIYINKDKDEDKDRDELSIYRFIVAPTLDRDAFQQIILILVMLIIGIGILIVILKINKVWPFVVIILPFIIFLIWKGEDPLLIYVLPLLLIVVSYLSYSYDLKYKFLLLSDQTEEIEFRVKNNFKEKNWK